MAKPFKEQLSASRTERHPYELLWDWCRMYLSGEQRSVTYDRGTDSLRPVRGREGYYQDNIILPLYRHIVSGLIVEYPTMNVLPASPSTEDVMRSRASLEAARYFWATASIKTVFRSIIEWLACCGNAAAHTYWDRDGRVVRSDPVSSYDYVRQKGTLDPALAQWNACRSLADKDELSDLHPKHADDIQATPAVQVKSQDSSGNTTVPDDSIEVWDVYWRDGRHEYRTEDLVLAEEQYNPQLLPVCPVWYLRVPGNIVGQGLVGDLVDIQRRYNELNRQVHLAIKRHADPYILVPLGSGVPSNSFRPGSAKTVPYSRAGGPPSYLLGATLPVEVYGELTRLIGRALDIAAVHSSSLGKSAKGITSAKQVDALKQADASQLTGTQEGLEFLAGSIMKTALVLMRQHYTEAMWVRFLDQTGEYVHRELQQTQIVDDPEIIIEAGSLFRNETADRRNKVLELYGAGLVSAEEAMQEISFGTSGKYVLDRIQQLGHAQELLKAARQGFDIEFFPGEDVAASKRVFEEFIWTDEYYQLPVEYQEHVALQFRKILAAAQPAPPGGELPEAPPPPEDGGPAQVPGTPAEADVSSDEGALAGEGEPA